jgi:hypothetical protein
MESTPARRVAFFLSWWSGRRGRGALASHFLASLVRSIIRRLHQEDYIALRITATVATATADWIFDVLAL